MRRQVKYGLIGGAFALVAGGVSGYTLLGGSDGSPQAVTTADGKGEGPTVKTGPLSATEVKTTAQKFLRAWQAGDAVKAAQLTDDAEAATTAITGYKTKAHIEKVTLTPGARKGDTVPYSVSGQISYKGERTTVDYRSSLTVQRDKSTGEPVITWQPTIIHPQLGEGDILRTDESEAPPIKALDRDGVELTKETHPSLAGVLDSLRDKYGETAGGTAGVEFFIQRAEAKKKADQKPDTTLKVLSEGTPGSLKTTLDSKLQTVTEKAVAAKNEASAVAIKPSTGEILAIANKPVRPFNLAIQGSMAPGSTMKVVTAGMLIDKGLTSPEKKHPCPKYVTVGGWKFQNLNKTEIKDGTFAQSFAASCNNAFISQAEKLKDDDLTKYARDVFGLGLTWETGIPSFDGSVPVQSDAQMAASLLGQGGVRMNPLNVASIAATVQAGGFNQPHIVSPDVDNRTLAKAPREMKPGTAADLKSLMKLTATAGTAADAMTGLSGDIGAKTGSAEVDGQKKPNAWFTAFRGDLAAAAVVPDSGHGGKNAGPLVRTILQGG